MKNPYTVITILITISVMVITMGCTTVDAHEKYSQATITEKFSKSQPLFGVNPELVENPAWYSYDYFIRYTSEGVQKVDRVSQDTYTSVFEGNTYTLKWGYIDDFNCIHKEYGYIGVISQVR
jgi:hypothetical protein